MRALITDRTQQDVNLLQELTVKLNNGASTETLAQWREAVKKGAYGVPDIERVDGATEELVQWLADLGYIVDYFKTDPSKVWLTESQAARYLQNIQNIRERLDILAYTGDLPKSLEKLNFEGANEIERVLEQIEGIIDSMPLSYFYSGEVYSGEV